MPPSYKPKAIPITLKWPPQNPRESQLVILPSASPPVCLSFFLVVIRVLLIRSQGNCKF